MGASRNTATVAASITQQRVNTDSVEIRIEVSGIAERSHTEHHVEMAVEGNFNVRILQLIKTKQVEAFTTLGKQHPLLPDGQYRCGFVVKVKRALHAGYVSANFQSFSYVKK
jgi:hypothetical protein